MREYITKAKVIEAIEKAVAPEITTIGDYETIGVFTRESIEQIVSKLPAADVAEVRHGRWVDKTDISRAAVEQRVDCSVCGQIFWTMSALLFNYCPNCGARMDEEDEHETS